MNPSISLIIIGYNSRRFLQTCFDAIFAQTYPGDMEVIFIDNNSSDDSVEFVRQTYAEHLEGDSHRRLTVIKNPDNIGYTGAANQGIFMSRGEYVVITNPDIIYTPVYLGKAIAHMESDASIAALTGKIIKYDFDAQNADGTRGRPTNLIDTVGLAIFRSRRVIDDGQGLPDDGRFDIDAVSGGHQVFGISGACPIYRRKALEDAKIETMDSQGKAAYEILDSNFFMYKEDVDLSWRLTLLGWKCWFDPRIVAYHGRGTGVQQRFDTRQMLSHRDALTPFQKSYSFTNQRLMQVKNELSGNFWHDALSIVVRELGSLIYITVKEPYNWKSLIKFFRLLPSTRRKRRQIMAKAEERWRDRGGLPAAAKYMQQWFVNKSRYVE